MYEKYECFVMHMLYVCVVCASCGSSQCYIQPLSVSLLGSGMGTMLANFHV